MFQNKENIVVTSATKLKKRQQTIVVIKDFFFYLGSGQGPKGQDLFSRIRIKLASFPVFDNNMGLLSRS